MKCLVFSGGAEKGISYIGVLKFLEENNLLNRIECMYGTSIGAVIAAVISIGYTSRELEYLVFKTNIRELFLPDDLNIESLINEFGFHEPHKLHKLIRLLLDKKTGIQNITFKQHFDKYNIKLVITGSCLSEYKCYYFNVDNYPDLPIFEAIFISICIPIIFKPITFENKLFVDGAIYDNYPVYDASTRYDLNDILGFFLINDHYGDKKNIDSIDQYLLVLLKSIDIKCIYLPFQLYNDISVFIKINYIKDTKDLNKLINMGYDAMKEYYNTNTDRFHQPVKIKLNGIDNKDVLFKYNDK